MPQELVPYTAVFAALVTAGFGLWSARASAAAARKQPFLLKQMELCFEAAQCVACLATLTDRERWNAARDRFWQLYYGVLAIVEGHQVEACMVTAGEILHDAGASPKLPLGVLCGPSLDLSRKIRALLINTWDIQSIDAKLAGSVTIFGEVGQTFWTEFNKQMAKSHSAE